jgi:hypothetical protein
MLNMFASFFFGFKTTVFVEQIDLTHVLINTFDLERPASVFRIDEFNNKHITNGS